MRGLEGVDSGETKERERDEGVLRLERSWTESDDEDCTKTKQTKGQRGKEGRREKNWW